MITKFKKLLYFPIAYYFRFFAKIQLAIWKPRVVVVTGSSGKTTLLHLIESQIGETARYSHNANSSFGIPFDILGLRRTKLTLDEWPYLFLAAPFMAFKKPFKEKLYVVEADCDRPYEGKFLGSLLEPEVTLWTNVGKSHTMNFDKLFSLNNRHSGDSERSVEDSRIPTESRDSGLARMTHKKFVSVEDAIAHEFGYFLEHTKQLTIVNGDSKLIIKEVSRSKANIKTVSQKQLQEYKLHKNHTGFKIENKLYKINYLLPKDTFYSIQMTNILLNYLKIKPDLSFSKFSLPPGRCSLLKGIKNTTIIDSSYNATPDGVRSILTMFDKYPSNKKWLVLGDMIELGNEEKVEHEKLADLIEPMKLEKVILVGPRLLKYTYPKMTQNVILSEQSESKDPLRFKKNNGILRYAQNDMIVQFTMPKEALVYLLNNLKGGEVILFKGARFLEGIIEHLLVNKKDIGKLCRREKIWQIRRTRWGL